MAIVTLRLPEVKAAAEKRPRECSHLRMVSGLLGIWQRAVCHMTVWRDIQWAALRRPAKPKVRVAGLDGFYCKVKGQEKGLMVMLDMSDATERAIGRWRNRSKTTRGFKCLAGLFAAFRVCSGMYA